METFYMTLGEGQPYYPGYFKCIAKDEYDARELTYDALEGRWCGTYDALIKVHASDRIYRGYINYPDGLQLDGVPWK